jgi:hypothetical protein
MNRATARPFDLYSAIPPSFRRDPAGGLNGLQVEGRILIPPFRRLLTGAEWIRRNRRFLACRCGLAAIPPKGKAPPVAPNWPTGAGCFAMARGRPRAPLALVRMVLRGGCPKEAK